MSNDKPNAPDTSGLFERCRPCTEIVYRPDWEANLWVCPHCGHHAAMPTNDRIEAHSDPGSFIEWDAHLGSADPLGFSDTKAYPVRLEQARKRSGRKEAVVTGQAALRGRPIALGVLDFAFMGGSMGSVVGEKLARLFEKAVEAKLPVIVFSASGGARMQEGILSLMQMAKTCAARALLGDAKLAYISVLLNPTTGGVAASYAFLGDVILAEPNALIGFAGPRVIEQTIGQELPKGFQRAEFCLAHGAIDAIVPRRELTDRLAQVVSLLMDD